LTGWYPFPTIARWGSLPEALAAVGERETLIHHCTGPGAA
jgi:hypothetical protein